MLKRNTRSSIEHHQAIMPRKSVRMLFLEDEIENELAELRAAKYVAGIVDVQSGGRN
jgi:hypothetical protein